MTMATTEAQIPDHLSSLNKCQLMNADHIQTVDGNNNQNGNAKLNDPIFTLGSDTGSSVDKDNNSFKRYDEEDDNNNDDEQRDALSEQRSESDSDLESCDDFSADDDFEKTVGDNGTNKNTGNNENNAEDRRDDKESITSNEYIQDKSDEATQELISQEIVCDDKKAPGQPTSPTGDKSTRRGQHHEGPNSIDPDPLSRRAAGLPDDDSRATAANEDYPRLTEEDILGKLVDSDVSGHSDIIDRVKNINVTNLSKLQQMDRSDPAVKRLLVRPRVTSKEVKNVSIDGDIKSMVSEFLKTNITGNFIITRVLRENYATFYSWLATHLQVERNAWAARLKQALEKMEHERKEHVDTNSLVKESAARLRNLVQSCSTIMFGLPGNNDKTREMKTGRPAQFGPRTNGTSSLHSGRMGYEKNRSKAPLTSSLPENESAYQARKQSFHQRLSTLGRLNERSVGGNGRLTQSSFNLVKVASRTSANYESDPGVYSSSRDFYRSDNSDKGVSKGSNPGHGHSSTIKSSARTKDSFSRISDYEEQVNFSENETDPEEFQFDDDDHTDWRQVIKDSVEVLSDICDTLANERAACLRLVGVKPNHCSSLVDAVSNYAQDRHTSGNSKRREIEKRLGLLEKENKTLVDEMTKMQNTLADKNNDALSLQKQLDKLESMMTANTSPKVHKCVGTEDSVIKISNKAAGINKLSKSPYGASPLGKSPLGQLKISRSPNLHEKLTQEINGIHIVMPQRKKTGQDGKLKSSQNITDNSAVENNGSFQGKENQTSHLGVPAMEPCQPLREKSLIEISEEKLKTLKQRARKLEDSLHDAISSMERLNKMVPSDDNASIISGMSASTVASILSKSSKGRHQQKFWKKSSSQVHGSLASRVIPDVSVSTPGHNSLSLELKEPSDTDGSRPPYESDKSSLLSGRSVVLNSHDMSDRTQIPSSLRVSAAPAPTPISRVSHVNNPHENQRDIQRNHEMDSTKEDEYDSDMDFLTGSMTAKALPFSSTQIKTKPKVTSRNRPSGKGIVTKCLRCQKLFSCVDNHKLACCYHTKDKERMEHYDPSGKLIKVVYAWKCCLQPQDIEGCCYGKHV